MAEFDKKQSDKKPEKETQANSKDKAPEKEAKTAAIPKKELEQLAARSKPPAQVAPRKEPLVSFERWFKARAKTNGYKPHWVAGMQAFTDTSTKRSMSDWDSVFKNY